MRALLFGLAFFSMVLSAGSASRASDGPSEPTARNVEQLLQDLLTRGASELPSLSRQTNPYENARLMDFELVSLNQLSSSRWHAEVELLIDFGPPPPYVLGFERVRSGLYRVVLEQRGERFGLARFGPVGQVHPLPAADR